MNDPYRSLPVIEAQVLVDYMKEITDAVEKLSGKMETLGHRVATLETHLNQPHKSLPTNSRSFNSNISIISYITKRCAIIFSITRTSIIWTSEAITIIYMI